MIGSFQREHFYRRSERRWRELARTAELIVALADFPSPAQPRDAPVEIPVQRSHPLAREWALVISAGDAQACLTAWEQPAPDPLRDDERRFEVLWSFDPGVVADAILVVADLLRPLDAAIAARLGTGGQTVPGAGAALDHGGALAQRMVGYLGRIVDAQSAETSTP